MSSKNVNSKEVLEIGTQLESILSYVKTESPKVSRAIHLLELIYNCSTSEVEKLKEIKKGSKEWASKLKTEELNDDENLPKLMKEDLRDDINEWRIEFRSALEGSFITFPKVDFPIEKLKKGPDGLISEKANKKLTKAEREGLREACYSLLAENYTALELVALRTVSSILKRWYEKKTGGNISGSWTTILEKLANEYPDKKPSELSLLGYLLERKKVLMNTARTSTKSDAETTLNNVLNITEHTKSPRPKTY